jgi:hypothetical protein
LRVGLTLTADPMAIAYFSTWTTYGTWLPGDQRCWYQPGLGIQLPDQIRQYEAALRMTESAVLSLTLHNGNSWKRPLPNIAKYASGRYMR